MKQAVSRSQSKKISEDSNAELKSLLAGLCKSMNEGEGTMDSVIGEVKR